MLIFLRDCEYLDLSLSRFQDCKPQLLWPKPFPMNTGRGILFGLSLLHSQAHVSRSPLEGICYRRYSVIQPFDRNSIKERAHPEACALDFYMTQFKKYIRLYWKLKYDFE